MIDFVVLNLGNKQNNEIKLSNPLNDLSGTSELSKYLFSIPLINII